MTINHSLSSVDDDDEDSKEDPTDYPADHDDDDDEEEPSGDDANEEDEEQDEDNDDKEEEHPALADSIPLLPALRVTARISFRPQLPTLSVTKEDAERADRPEVTLPPQKRLNIVHCPRYEAGESLVAATAGPMEGYKVGESLVVASARPIEGRMADYGFVDSVEAEIRRRRAKDIGYEEALTTLEGVNTRVKFATCTLLASALTWWNSYVRIVGNDVTYMMAWIELKKKMADKYCPRNEMTKIETEF
nr:reverse transcriptase domain-containing protein [Tanacetum cinerariifolium]